jgi:hypothetical protein
VPDVYALVREIREKRLPRNRNFDAYETADGAEARRLHRFLRGIERDLLAAEEVSVEPPQENGQKRQWRITMRFPSVRLRRIVSLTEDERAILLEDPRVALLLR